MASCDDDFAILGGDDNNTPQPSHHHQHHRQPPPSHHHQQPHPSHHHHQQPFDRFIIKPLPIQTQSPQTLPPPEQPLSSPKKIEGEQRRDGDGEGQGEDNYSEAGPQSFPFDEPNHHFIEETETPNKSRANSRPEKRRDRDELSDGGTAYYKRSKNSTEYRVDCRKDREEWSDTAIGSLLDAYTDKFNQLNRGNLRGRDWEEVSATVSERCDKSKNGKSVDQCKNKLDNLKKRFKVEIQRMTNAGTNVSHWVWFKKMEDIVNSSNSAKAVSDEDKTMVVSANILRQAKRYPIATNANASPTTSKGKSLTNPRWRRVVFKISGAALAGSGSQNIDPKVALLIAKEVASACRVGVEVAIVVGGRNFFCGESWVNATELDRPAAYQIGMMATVMNSILLQSALEKNGIQTRVQSMFAIQEVAEPYCKRRAIRHLEKGRVVIFGGIGASTGCPLFTTDLAAAMRASEINAEAVLKGTNVDGVYDDHSKTNTSAVIEHISFRELVSRDVSSLDLMAATSCEEHGIPVVVFNLLEPGNISKALCGEPVGTLIDQAGRAS